jgi:hypothetical protein
MKSVITNYLVKKLHAKMMYPKLVMNVLIAGIMER